MPLLFLWVLVAIAQNEPAPPAFEAASLKPVAPGRTALRHLSGGPGTSSPGQLTGVATLKGLLMQAYGLKDYQILGPSWIETDRFEVAAKIPAGANQAQVAGMLQLLLAQRFRLAVRRETRELSVYALVVAKDGPRLARSSEPGEAPANVVPRIVKGPDGLPDLAPGSKTPRSYEVALSGPDGILYKLWARHQTMQQLADMLSTQLNRAVVDATSLLGQYDFTLAWTVESAGGFVPRTGPPPDQIEAGGASVLSGPDLSLFTSLPSQLGLKLDPQKAPLELLIVEKAERVPIEN